jgi:hypothetical protein
MIRFLPNARIDRAWWDDTLFRTGNRLWYAQSWVLDHCVPGWAALVDEASGAIMPLTQRRKWGIDYLFQPYGLQQLGVFGKDPSPQVLGACLRAAGERYRFVDIMVNGTLSAGDLPGYCVEPRTDQVLPLDKPLEALRAGYAKQHRRNLAAMPQGLRFGEVDLAVFADLFLATTAHRFGDRAAGFGALMDAVAEGVRREQCEAIGLYRKGDLLAAACFATWEGRSILLKSANTPAGREARAMFHLVDHWIGRYAGSGLLLDFAGSIDPGTARFNAGFGAVNRAYLRLRHNRLPWPLRLLKR